MTEIPSPAFVASGDSQLSPIFVLSCMMTFSKILPTHLHQYGWLCKRCYPTMDLDFFSKWRSYVCFYILDKIFAGLSLNIPSSLVQLASLRMVLAFGGHSS